MDVAVYAPSVNTSLVLSFCCFGFGVNVFRNVTGKFKSSSVLGHVAWNFTLASLCIVLSFLGSAYHQSNYTTLIQNVGPVLTPQECTEWIEAFEETRMLIPPKSPTELDATMPRIKNVDSIPSLERAANSLKSQMLVRMRQSFNIATEAELGSLRLYIQTLTEGQTASWKREDDYHLSFTINLSERKQDFHGGGSDFPMFRLRVHLEQGEALLVPARVLRGEAPVLNGTRHLLRGVLTVPSRHTVDIGSGLESYFFWPLWGWLAHCAKVDLRGTTEVICNSFRNGPRRDFGQDPGRLVKVIFGQNMDSPPLPGSPQGGRSSSLTGLSGNNWNLTNMCYAVLMFFTAKTIMSYSSPKDQAEEIRSPTTATAEGKAASKAAGGCGGEANKEVKPTRKAKKSAKKVD